MASVGKGWVGEMGEMYYSMGNWPKCAIVISAWFKI